MSEIGTVEFVFLLLLLFIVVFGLLARKLKMPYPIVMVIGGLLLGFVPGIPEYHSQSRPCLPGRPSAIALRGRLDHLLA